MKGNRYHSCITIKSVKSTWFTNIYKKALQFVLGAFLLLGIQYLVPGSIKALPISGYSGNTVVHHYEIRAAGIKIGNLVAEKTISGEETTYNLKSDVSFYLLRRHHIIDKVTSVYRGNILLRATVHTTVGHENYLSTITWNDDHYDIDINNYYFSRSAIVRQPIAYSVSRIYFEKPPAGVKVFSEDYGVFSDQDELQSQIIQLSFMDKNNKFRYVGGEMTEANIENSVKNFVIRRVD